MVTVAAISKTSTLYSFHKNPFLPCPKWLLGVATLTHIVSHFWLLNREVSYAKTWKNNEETFFLYLYFLNRQPSFFLGKEEVKDGEPAKWTKKNNLPEVTKTWHDYMIREVVQDFQHAVLQVSDMPYEEEVVSNIPQVSYEFPNGYSNEFGIERFKISEALFDPNKIRVPNANTMLSVAHVVTTSVGK